MDCIKNDRHGAEILIDYCAGAIDPEIASTIDEHIQHCAECKKLVDGQFAVWETLDAWTPVEVSSNFDARLYARIAAEQSGPAWLPRMPHWWPRLLRPATPHSWWKPAASLAVAAAIVSLVVATRIPRQTQASVPQTVAAGPAATAAVPAPGAAPSAAVSSAASSAEPPAAASSASEDIDLQQVQQALDDLEILAPASQSASSPL